MSLEAESLAESESLVEERIEALLSKAKDRDMAEKLISMLREAGLAGVPILVEGKRDEAALRAIGVEGKIYKVTERGIMKVAEEITQSTTAQKNSDERVKTAIILTDPDHEGSKLASRAAYVLEQFGVHPDMRFRKLCWLLGKGAVEHLG